MDREFLLLRIPFQLPAGSGLTGGQGGDAQVVGQVSFIDRSNRGFAGTDCLEPISVVILAHA